MPGGEGAPHFTDGDIGLTGIEMTILSCDPLHATGSGFASGDIYDVEITE
jgi:hypothetical protein